MELIENFWLLRNRNRTLLIYYFFLLTLAGKGFFCGVCKLKIGGNIENSFVTEKLLSNKMALDGVSPTNVTKPNTKMKLAIIINLLKFILFLDMNTHFQMI